MVETFQRFRKAVVAALGVGLLVAGDADVAAAEDIPSLLVALVTVVGVVLARNE